MSRMFRIAPALLAIMVGISGAATPALAGVSTTTTTFPDTTTTTTFPEPLGACCHQEGCSEVSKATCLDDFQGAFQGDGTACDDPGIVGICDPPTTTTTSTTLPPDPLGACCYPGGCAKKSETDCLHIDGSYQGDGTACDDPAALGICDTTTTTTTSSTTTTTLPVGACCHGSACDVVLADECDEGLLGSYQGDGTSCQEPGICVDCGSGCVDFGETCDDGNVVQGDGCDEKCQVEACFECSEETEGNARTVLECGGPSVCEPAISEECAVCGDGEIYPGEDCDDGNTDDGDCCSATCLFESPGSPCPDGVFCDGVEVCDGAGACDPAPAPADCSSLDTECATGVCDIELDVCVADPTDAEGDPCNDPGDCAVPDSGVCEGGACVGEGTTLAPSCRWVVVGGSPDGPVTPVRVRSGEGSTVDANTCGDTARYSGITNASMVATNADAGFESMRFTGPPEVAGDIVTGGSSMRANLYLDIPGTTMKQIAGGMVVAKDPTGTVDTTGSHPLVQMCVDDKAVLPVADAALAAMLTTSTVGDSKGLKVKIGDSATIDVTGAGVAVVETANLRVSHGATLTLRGLPGDVLMLRVTGNRLKFGYGSQLVLDGLLPENVLLYGQGRTCRLQPGVVGGGTMFCPGAGKFVVGVGTDWAGSFLGGTREVRLRHRAILTHTPFTGF